MSREATTPELGLLTILFLIGALLALAGTGCATGRPHTQAEKNMLVVILQGD